MRGLILFGAALAISFVLSASAEDTSCWKNHYILDDNCAMAAAALVPIGAPGAVTVDPSGNVYFSSPNLVFKLDVTGKLTRVAGSAAAGFAGDGGPAVASLLSFAVYPEMADDPYDYGDLVAPLVTDADGNLYIGDPYNNRVRRVDANGIINTVAGTGTWATSGGLLPEQLILPQGIVVDADHNLYVADASSVIKKFSPADPVAILAGPNCGHHLDPGLCGPGGMARDAAGHIYVPDGYCRVRRLGQDGSVETIAGADTRPSHGFSFTCGNYGEGTPATEAALAWPSGVALDPRGQLYIADTYNDCIRMVDTAGIITTFAGSCGNPGFAGDGGPARNALLRKPRGVAVDAEGNVYIADTDNRRVRVVVTDGVIATIAGTGQGLEAP